MASMVPGEEAATPTTTRRRLTSTVWDGYTINYPADGGAPTATCLECRLTLCAGSNNGTSHLRRHTKSKKCQQLAAERELGRRQPTSPSTTAAEPSPGNDNDDYCSPSPPPPVVVEDEEENDLFTMDGIYIPELYDKLIAEGLHNIEQSNAPAVPQAASSSTRWFINKTKERRKAENKKRCAPDDESGLQVSAQPDFGLVRLAGCQPANSVFLSHQFSTSHQPPASQQYFSLTINQPQPPATSQPNEAFNLRRGKRT